MSETQEQQAARFVENSIADITGLTPEQADAAMKSLMDYLPQTKSPKEYIAWLKEQVRTDDNIQSVVCGMFITILMLGSMQMVPPQGSSIIKP